jgi:hypothetical protein
MSKGEFRLSLALIFFINYFIVFTVLNYHYLPYWANMLLVNAGGLFCGFLLGAVLESKLKKKTP